MKENQKNTYSLKEKFLLVGPEKRIRRMVFFTRSVVLNVGINIILFAIGSARFAFPEFGEPNAFFLASLLVATNIALFFFQSSLITKRCNDFDSDGAKYANFYKIFLVISTIISVLSIMGASNISSTISFEMLESNLQFVLRLFYVYPLLRPGTPGDNKYGPDDSNLKMGFLG